MQGIDFFKTKVKNKSSHEIRIFHENSNTRTSWVPFFFIFTLSI